jgi:hypothetical protein
MPADNTGRTQQERLKLAEKNKKSLFSFKTRLTKTEKKARSSAVRNTFLIFALIIIAVALVAGFIFMDRFVKKTSNFGAQALNLELLDVPDWVGPQLQQRIVETARKGGVEFILNETIARQVGENLRTFAWLYDVQVIIGPESIIVKAAYRKPVALIKAQDDQFFIDSQAVVLDYIPVDKLIIPEITGVSAYMLTSRSIGTKWQSADVAAAIELLELLTKMDKQITPDKPLLAEIASIDMSNFDGRRNSSEPHIVFYAKDGTEIKWGAKKGDWNRNLEAKDEEKLTILYNTYAELGTIQIRAAQKGSFIDLTKPQTLSLPIDKYKQ